MTYTQIPRHIFMKAPHNRGRQADWPHKIPIRGWFDILVRTKKNISANNTGLIAAGIAFYFFLALFPAIAVLVSLFGLIADPALITDQILQLSSFLPEPVVDILSTQAEKIALSSSRTLSLSLVLSVAITLYAASKGVKALIKGLNIAYKEQEDRGLIRQNLLALELTFFVVVMALLSFTAVAILPAIINLLNLGGISETLMYVRWPLLLLAGIVVLECLYRYAPSREQAKWRWLSVGSFITAVSWVGISALFSWYVSSFGKYNETYGTLAAVVILMMWLWLSSLALLIGAEINSAIEHQTYKDSTKGADKPLGQRGAYVADTIGAARNKPNKS